jgi:hypothetical protein
MPASKVRPAGAKTPGGASSLLRLSSGAGEWIGRAARALRHEQAAAAA